MEWIILFSIGLVAGILGSLLGLGGGFIIIPILMEFYPALDHIQIASISLSVVFINALVSVLVYWKMKKVNILAGIVMGIVAIPGGIIGTMITPNLSQDVFKSILGVLFLFLSAYMIFNSRMKREVYISFEKPPIASIPCTIKIENSDIQYFFNPFWGTLISSVVSIFSGMMGIGGGIFIVPLFVLLMKFPLQAAIPTSHVILVFLSFTGTMTNILHHRLDEVYLFAILLGSGVFLGALIGASYFSKLNSGWITKIFAIVLLYSGIRFLI